MSFLDWLRIKILSSNRHNVAISMIRPFWSQNTDSILSRWAISDMLVDNERLRNSMESLPEITVTLESRSTISGIDARLSAKIRPQPKDCPHPHDLSALGFVIWKPPPIRVSLKSTCIPDNRELSLL